MDRIEESVLSTLGDRIRPREHGSVRAIVVANLPRCLAPDDGSLSAFAHAAPPADPAAHIAEQIRETAAFLRAALPGRDDEDPWLGFVAEGLDRDFEVQLSAVPALLRLVASLPGTQLVVSLDGMWCCYWNFGEKLRFGFSKRLG